jgi:hypothetical protein
MLPKILSVFQSSMSHEVTDYTYKELSTVVVGGVGGGGVKKLGEM